MRLTKKSLLDAVTDGALLRLRPKVMTVSTVVAALTADHVEHERGFRGDEAPRGSGSRRYGVELAARAGDHAGDFLLAAATRIGAKCRISVQY